MEKEQKQENHPEVIVEAMRLADKFTSLYTCKCRLESEYLVRWNEAFSHFMEKVSEVVNPVKEKK